MYFSHSGMFGLPHQSTASLRRNPRNTCSVSIGPSAPSTALYRSALWHFTTGSSCLCLMGMGNFCWFLSSPRKQRDSGRSCTGTTTGCTGEQAIQNTVTAVFLQTTACTVSPIETSNKVEFALEMKFSVTVLFIQCISPSSSVFPAVTM